MRFKRSMFEWQTIDDDNTWSARFSGQESEQLGAPSRQARRQRHGHLPVIILVLCILMMFMGASIVPTQRQGENEDQVGTISATGEEISAALPNLPPLMEHIPIDPEVSTPWHYWLQKQLDSQHQTTVVQPQLTQVSGDVAMMDVAILTKREDGGGGQFLQTQFYRHTAEGWLQTAPVAALWGPKSTAESGNIRIHYRARDARAAKTIVARVARDYAKMRSMAGLSSEPADGHIVTIQVSVEKAPSFVPIPFRRSTTTSGRLTVPSPAVMMAPSTLSKMKILHQSIMLELGEQILAELITGSEGRLPPAVIDALRLSFLWETDSLLAADRAELMRLLFGDHRIDTVEINHRQKLSGDLCGRLEVLSISPEVLSLPVQCSRMGVGTLPSTSLPFGLVGLSYGHPDGDTPEVPPHPGTALALATVLDYVDAVHGREYLSVLLPEFGHHPDWQSLVKNTFGLSLAEFEMGWREYVEKSRFLP